MVHLKESESALKMGIGAVRQICLFRSRVSGRQTFVCKLR